MPRISIDPATRLEGHGRVDIFLDDDGAVENAYLQVPELRGFESFVRGRPVEEMPGIVTRICGICPGAHHICSGKAADAVYRVQPPPGAVKLRELFYCAHFIHSHIAHLYLLAAPDLLAAGPARNFPTGFEQLGGEAGAIRHRAMAQEIQALLGGKATHPSWVLPGGVAKGMPAADRERVRECAARLVEFAVFSLRFFEERVLRQREYLDVVRDRAYRVETHYLGLVDGQNRVTFYDGTVRVSGPDGEETGSFTAGAYLEYLAEAVVPWSYMKFPYLRRLGWPGLAEAGGIYQVGPLARLNVASGMATPLAQEAYGQLFAAMGPKPVHAVLGQHWARLVELLYAAERLAELAADPETGSGPLRVIPVDTPGAGVGLVEAPRGLLIHHYQADERGIVKQANFLPGTTHNNAAIGLALKKAAARVIRPGRPVTEDLLNRVETVLRAFDPCFSCSTHALAGPSRPKVRVFRPGGELVRELGESLDG